MSAVLSHISKAFRDTVIARSSDGEALKDLSSLYGIPKPGSWPDEEWRHALKASALAPRGTFGCVFGFLLGAFGGQATKVTATRYFGDPLTNGQLHPAGGAVNFPATDVYKWVYIKEDEKLYMTVGPSVTLGTSVVPHLDLCPVDTMVCSKADWSTISSTGSDTVTCYFLPFYMYDCSQGYAGADAYEPTQSTLFIDVSIPSTNPPTFLVDYATPVTAIPPGTAGTEDVAGSTAREHGVGAGTKSPYGGQVQEDESVTGGTLASHGNAIQVGPHPPYLAGDGADTMSTFEMAMRAITGASVRVVFTKLAGLGV